jgi:hypothetical protein
MVQIVKQKTGNKYKKHRSIVERDDERLSQLIILPMRHGRGMQPNYE